MFRKLDCELQTHQGMHFYGICLNKVCKHSPICCNKCLQENHIEHVKDVKLKEEIDNFLKQNYNYSNIMEIVSKWKSSIIEQLKTIEQYIQQEYLIFKLTNEVPNRTAVKEIAKKMKILRTQEELSATLKKYNFQQEFKTLLNTVKCIDDSFQQMMNDQDEEQNNDPDNSTRKSKSYTDLKNQYKIQQQNWQPQQNDHHTQQIQQGIQLAQQQKYQEALQIFNQILQSNSTNIDALLQIAWIHNQMNDYPKALNCLDKILGQQKDNVQALCLKGFVLYTQYRYKDALVVYVEALQYQNQNQVALDGTYKCRIKLSQEQIGKYQ